MSGLVWFGLVCPNLCRWVEGSDRTIIPRIVVQGEGNVS